MARILRQDIYPFKNPISLNDYVIGTDSQNSNRTKNFRIGDFVGFIETVGLPNGIDKGEIVWTQDLSFLHTQLEGVIDDNTYTIPSGAITGPNADPTNSRTDIIVADAAGNVSVVQGIAAANPIEPIVLDPLTTVKISAFSVAALATQPTGIVKTLMYDEDAGTGGGEFNVVATGSGINLANTINPNTGAVSISLNGIVNTGAYVSMLPSVVQTIQSFTNIHLYLNNSIEWTNTSRIKAAFFSSGIQVSSFVSIRNGCYGLVSDILNQYQSIILPKDDFQFRGNSWDEIQFQFENLPAGVIYLDTFNILGGIENPPRFGSIKALSDMPDSYVGKAGYVAQINDSETGWNFVPFTGGGSVLVNDEDINFNLLNELQFKDRDNVNQLGYKIIRDDFDWQNIPASYGDSIWELRYEYDLGGNDVTFPTNVTLDFKGGKISNYGLITFDQTLIKFDGIYPIFDASGIFTGGGKTVGDLITPIHFGAQIMEGVTTVGAFDCTNAFNKTVQFVGSQNVNFIGNGRPSYTSPRKNPQTKVEVPGGTYFLTDSIIFRQGQVWEGNKSNTLLLFEPELKLKTGTINDYRRFKSFENFSDFALENTYADRDAMLADQVNQTNQLRQFVIDARTAQEILDGDPVYDSNFLLNLNKDLFIVDGDIDTDFNYGANVMENVRVKGFTLTGDVRYDGTGNAGNGIYTNNASQLKFEDVYISKFTRGVSVNIGDVARSAYYNKFKNVQIQYVKQALMIGEGTAVTDFEDCIFVSRAETIVRYDHLIEAYNNTTFRDCSFEGGTPTEACIYAPIGKICIIGGRDESNSLLKFGGRGVTGGVTAILPNGPTGQVPSRFGEITDVDQAPLAVDMSLDQNVLTQNINFGQGVAQEVEMLRNQNWKFGMEGWLEDGTDGYYELINDRAELMGSPNGVKVTKTLGGSYALTQPVKLNSSKTYISVWVKESADAILRLQLGVLKASDDPVTNYFKEFVPILKNGDWTLYVASVAHYYKLVPNSDPRPYLGLTSDSPISSWVIFSNLRFFTGGFSAFPSSPTDKVVKDFVLTQLPTEGFLQLGDRVRYDGSDASYPIGTDAADGVDCTFNLDTVTTTAVVATDTSFDITSTANVKIGDHLGIWADDGQMTWSTITDLVGNTVTINDGIVSVGGIGNKVYIYRLVDFGVTPTPVEPGTLVLKGYWNPNTNSLSDLTGVIGETWIVEEDGNANLGRGLGADEFNTGVIANSGNTTASFVIGGLDATSDGTGIVLRPRVLWSGLNIGSTYELEITSITLNSGANPTYSLYNGTSYERNNVNLVTELVTFVANGVNVFFALDGTGTFDVSILVTLKEVTSDSLNTYDKGDIISHDGSNYFIFSNNN